MSRDLTITLGALTLPGRLPLIPTAAQLSHAWHEALTAADPSTEEIVRLGWAAVGLCWAGPRPDGAPASLRAAGWDLLEYGEAWGDALYRAHGVSLDVVFAEGKRLVTLCRDSIPTREEVAEAEAPFAGSGGSSTSTT